MSRRQAMTLSSILRAAAEMRSASSFDAVERLSMRDSLGPPHGAVTHFVGSREPRRAVLEQVRTAIFFQQGFLDLFVRPRAAIGQQVLDPCAALGQPPRHENGAMAVERLLLGTHQAKRGVVRRLDDAVESRLEGGARGARLAAQRFTLPAIVDAGLGQALGQAFAAELREAARV